MNERKKPVTIWLSESTRDAIKRYQLHYEDEVGILISRHKILDLAVRKLIAPYLACEAIVEDAV